MRCAAVARASVRAHLFVVCLFAQHTEPTRSTPRAVHGVWGGGGDTMDEGLGANLVG
jgi:hypothetical protein